MRPISEFVNLHWELPGINEDGVSFLGNHGGFSGAQLWQLSNAHGKWLLRRWPAQQSVDRVLWIHQTIQQICQQSAVQGAHLVLANPTQTRQRRTLVESGDYIYQVEPWLDGSTCDRPNQEQLVLVMHALAVFHNASQQVETHVAANPTIISRLNTANSMQTFTELKLHQSLARADSQLKQELLGIAEEVCRSFHRNISEIQIQLRSFEQGSTLLIPCLRDVWHAHLLHQENGDIGMIDYGAMKLDFFGTDLARLIGSFQNQSSSLWEFALDAYWERRNRENRQNGSKSVAELNALIHTLNGASALMAPMNWITWIFLENRQFENHDAVILRVKECVKRMQFWEDSSSEFRY